MLEAYMNGLLAPRTMTLTGQGQVAAPPNMAVLRLGVELTGTDLSAIQSQNALLSQSVLNALRRMGITDVKTFQYNIEKYYEYGNGTPVHRGYTVRNIFEIRTGETDLIGAIIDTAVDSGANVVELISFQLSDPEYYYRQALNLAVRDAMEKARSVANHLGIRVEPIPVSLTETSGLPQPFLPVQRELATTPVVPGNITIEASITAEFTY